MLGQIKLRQGYADLHKKNAHRFRSKTHMTVKYGTNPSTSAFQTTKLLGTWGTLQINFSNSRPVPTYDLNFELNFPALPGLEGEAEGCNR